MLLARLLINERVPEGRAKASAGIVLDLSPAGRRAAGGHLVLRETSVYVIRRFVCRADVERFVSGEDATGARVVAKAVEAAADEGDGGERAEPRQRKQKAYAT